MPGQSSRDDRDRDERGEGETGHGHQPLRHTRVVKPREMAPERLVPGQVRTEREEDRDESAQAEDQGEAELPPQDEDDEPGDREADDGPPQVDDLLQVVGVPREEVGGTGREVLDLPELAPARAGRVPHREHVGDQPGRDQPARPGERPIGTGRARSRRRT